MFGLPMSQIEVHLPARETSALQALSTLTKYGCTCIWVTGGAVNQNQDSYVTL